MIREFKLTNSSGVTYNLTEPKSFLFDVGGLGFSEATEYRSIGNHYKPLQRRLSQPAPSGTIYFGDWDTCYAEYHRFALFCQDTPLVLSYFQHTATYYMQVAVNSLSKTEIGEKDGLECDVEFVGLSPWYEIITAEEIPIVTNESKTYDYAYSPRSGDPDYGYIYGGETSMQLSIRSNSRMKSPVKLCIHGPVINPSWTLTCDGKTIGAGRMLVTIDENSILVVDNTTPDFTITKTTLSGDLPTDVYQLSDFNTDRFLYLGYGLNTLSVSHEGTRPVVIEVTAHVEYETV